MSDMKIVAINDRAEQGQHRPFRCRADDGELYYVKGASVGFRGLCSEWIAGRLAQELGLPIPDFQIVELPPDLLDLQFREDQHDLGRGMAFASKEVAPSTDFLFSDLEDVALELKARVLLFDWWICNVDRILGERGGNPNLIWSGTPRQLFIIDHNLAFSDDSELMPYFWQDHVYREAYPRCESHWQQWREDLEAASQRVPELWDELPEQWTEKASHFSLEFVQRILRRCEEAKFWKPITL